MGHSVTAEQRNQNADINLHGLNFMPVIGLLQLAHENRMVRGAENKVRKEIAKADVATSEVQAKHST